MANVKIPYALVPAVALETRYEQMQHALARGLPRLERSPLDTAKTLHIAAYGPSLRDTWESLKDVQARGEQIMAMSGSAKFLAERGIVVDWSIDMDPRANKVMTSLPPIPGVKYLVASVCCPAYFDALLAAGADVTLWHTVSSNFEQDLAWLGEHDPGSLLISTGSTIGLGAIQVGGVLGYNRFEVYGMDGSFSLTDNKRHAAEHHGKPQPDDITWQCNRVVYRTSKVMANAVAETINTAKNFPIVTIWHGDGLTQALIRKAKMDNACCADEAEKVARLRGLRPQIVNTPVMSSGKVSIWDELLKHLLPSDLPELVSNIAVCEARRVKARYNTGTIPFESAVQLRSLCRFYEPSVVAEVGTFIGTSTLALSAKRVVYTCDASNDCVESDMDRTPNIVTHPRTTSTQMLAEIQEHVDLFFFDGRIADEDIPHILRLSHDGTVYVFDDHVGREKGVLNVEKLAPHVAKWTLIMPSGPPSTLAVLVPYLKTEVRPK